MPRIAHLSDLHFGAHDEQLVAAVEQRMNELKPDLVVISGDFTQRATTDQFKEACRFLERLRDAGHEVLGVPGNHDVPLYDVLRRFLSPLSRYRRYIDETLCPFHELSGAAVLGINTARSATFKDGRINDDQVAFIRESFARTRPETMRVLVTHHPLFALPVGDGPALGEAVGRQQLALGAIADAGVDLLLAGHNHRASTHHARDLVTEAGPALVIQAGTATSTRLREEAQSFNLIARGPGNVAVTVEGWGGDGYRPTDTDRFIRRAMQWESAAGDQLAEAPQA
jgi:3',5'-cyclic AMP phosphodiesterase CpdA